MSATLTVVMSSPVAADWNFSGPPYPKAFIQTGNMSLELQCDRVRFAPAGYDVSEDIAAKQGLSFRFMENGASEVGAFQAGSDNSDMSMAASNPATVAAQNPARSA